MSYPMNDPAPHRPMPTHETGTTAGNLARTNGQPTIAHLPAMAIAWLELPNLALPTVVVSNRYEHPMEAPRAVPVLRTQLTSTTRTHPVQAPPQRPILGSPGQLPAVRQPPAATVVERLQVYTTEATQDSPSPYLHPQIRGVEVHFRIRATTHCSHPPVEPTVVAPLHQLRMPPEHNLLGELRPARLDCHRH
mgnify:CR=1 FL=1